MLQGVLDDALATRAAAELMALDALGDGPIDLYLTCPDGTLEATLALVDVAGALRAPLRAHCLGLLGGPVAAVLAVARERSAAPHASIRLGLPRTQVEGTSEHLAARSRQYAQLLRRLQECLARATGRPLEEIARDLRQGRALDAGEALAYGLIDRLSGAPAAR
jgi:ATP-dependent Clp protease protease subunit